MGNELDFNQKLGLRLQKCREKKGVTQQDIANATGLSRNHISALERGVYKMNVSTLVKYCELLDMTPNELLKIGNHEHIIADLENVLLKLDGEEQYKIAKCIELIKDL